MTTNDQTMQEAANVSNHIRDFIADNTSKAAELGDDDNIFELGFVTSLFAMRLLEFIEVTFDVEVPDESITLTNFSTVNRMTELVQSLRGANA